jgi:hypothetical protein
MIQEGMQAAYEQGCIDGSQFGSRGGSRTPSVTTSAIIRRSDGIPDASFQWDDTDVNLTTRLPQNEETDSRQQDFEDEDLSEHEETVLGDIVEEVVQETNPNTVHEEIFEQTTPEIVQENVQEVAEENVNMSFTHEQIESHMADLTTRLGDL